MRCIYCGEENELLDKDGLCFDCLIKINEIDYAKKKNLNLNIKPKPIVKFSLLSILRYIVAYPVGLIFMYIVPVIIGLLEYISFKFAIILPAFIDNSSSGVLFTSYFLATLLSPAIFMSISPIKIIKSGLYFIIIFMVIQFSTIAYNIYYGYFIDPENNDFLIGISQLAGLIAFIFFIKHEIKEEYSNKVKDIEIKEMVSSESNIHICKPGKTWEEEHREKNQ
jgi:hypothetical protein